MTPTAARVIYPELSDPLTPGDLQQLFSPSFEERQLAPTVARTAASQVALLVQLRIFQTIGLFRRVVDVPWRPMKQPQDVSGLPDGGDRAFGQEKSELIRILRPGGGQRAQ